MKLYVLFLLFVIGILFVQGVWVEDFEVLFKNKGCVVCYVIDIKMVGLVYKDVVVKFVGQVGVEVEFVQWIKNGSQGVWGLILMLLNVVSDDEVQILVKWVLLQK